MNDRIIELKKLATHQAIWPGDPDAGELDAETFAQLIIKACVDTCEKNSWIGLSAFQRSEQIKQLAEQAEEVVFSSPSTGRTTKQINLEKFAELLIQQCIDICLINQIKNENISAGECAYDIQEHFGVD